MKIAIILGTRPEIIKLYSIIKHCQQTNVGYFLIHTNQHYSKEMDQIFFEELELPKPDYNLAIGSGSHGKQKGRMIEKIETILIEEKPSHVFVQGDTNTTLAGALAASKLDCDVCHVEAGLRSYDRQMPEEINRVLSDHIADYLFCPTEKQKEILLSEGIDLHKIFVTGNTIVDAVSKMKQAFENGLLKQYNLAKEQYILLTMHRPANVDFKEKLSAHLVNIAKIAGEHALPVVFPVHPRTDSMLKNFAIKIPGNIRLIKPLGFKALLNLEANARIILTDSGGVLEEACILGVPSLNLRENTERPECVEIGASKIVGADYNKLRKEFNYYINSSRKWSHPFGMEVARKIFAILDSDKRRI